MEPMRFMVAIEVVVPPEKRAEVAALLPAERAHIDEQMRDGILEALYVEDKTPVTRVWAVMRGKSLEAVQQQVATYPLSPYFHSTYTALS